MIVVEQERESMQFCQIKPGDAFRANGSVWIKAHQLRTDPLPPAINLLTGQWWFPDPEQPVQPLPGAKLVVTP